MLTDSFLTIGDLSLHIRSSGNGKNAIVFIHGNSCSAGYWDDQLTDENLQANYQLISIDLPGHGSSGRLAGYPIEQLSAILVDSIFKLGLSSYVLAGHSYGTALIAEAAPRLKHCNGFFLSSPNITNDTYPPSSYIIPFPEILVMVSETAGGDELRKFAVHLMIDPSSVWVEKFIDSYLKTDPKFRVDLGKAMQTGSWSDEFKNLIDSGMPVKYVFGEKDQVLKTDYLDSIKLPANHSFIRVNNAAHFINVDQPETYNILLREFCDSIQ